MPDVQVYGELGALNCNAIAVPSAQITTTNGVTTVKRRDFIKMTGLAAGASLIPVYQVRADEMAHLSEDDPQAKALGYVVQSTLEGSHCANCAQAKGEGDWLGCNIFPGKQVKATGWCKVWTPRPA